MSDMHWTVTRNLCRATVDRMHLVVGDTLNTIGSFENLKKKLKKKNSKNFKFLPVG